MARVNYETWTPHQRRGKRFAFSSTSTKLRTDGSRDEYAPTAPTPGSHSPACSSCSKCLRKHSYLCIESDAHNTHKGKGPVMRIKSKITPANGAQRASHSVFSRWGHTAFRRRQLILLIA